jgi:hypothetical protein
MDTKIVNNLHLPILCFATLKNVLESTAYLLPFSSKPVFTEWYATMQNLREHKLSSVCLVVPFWLAVK